MTSRRAKITVRVVLFVVAIVVILALPMWLGTGPGGVVALTRAGASGSNSLEIHDPTFRKSPYRYHFKFKVEK
jgi:hypothetical protein